MKKNTFKHIFFLIAFIAFAASVTSCNKGYGCPNNFKAAKAAVSVLK